MDNTILLIVDVQHGLIDADPYNTKGLIQNIQTLIQNARENDVEIIYIQHNGGASSGLERGSKGWEIYHEISPEPTDKVFTKTFNSSFKETGLHEYLQVKGINRIILVGMLTNYCVDTTCKVAFELGYRVIIPQSATTTFDSDFLSGEATVNYYEQKIWNGRIADVMPVSEIVKEMPQKYMDY